MPFNGLYLRHSADFPFPKLEHMGLFKNASLGRLKYTQKMSIASFKLNPLDFDQPAPFSHKAAI